MYVAVNTKNDVRYERECRVCVTVVDVSYFLQGIDEWYLYDIGNHIINYVDNLEDTEYIEVFMYCTDDGDGDMNVCKIVQVMIMYEEDSCDVVLAFTKCEWCDRIAKLEEPL